MKPWFLVLALFAPTAVQAHSWYPALCCNGTEEGGDCHPVACDSLAETKAGIQYGAVIFNKDQTRVSFDRNCHVCISKAGIPHCVFIQPTT